MVNDTKKRKAAAAPRVVQGAEGTLSKLVAAGGAKRRKPDAEQQRADLLAGQGLRRNGKNGPVYNPDDWGEINHEGAIAPTDAAQPEQRQQRQHRSQQGGQQQQVRQQPQPQQQRKAGTPTRDVVSPKGSGKAPSQKSQRVRSWYEGCGESSGPAPIKSAGQTPPGHSPNSSPTPRQPANKPAREHDTHPTAAAGRQPGPAVAAAGGRHATAGAARAAPVSTAAAAAAAVGVAASPPRGRGGGVKYTEVVRKKAEREMLDGFECACCAAFYLAISTWGAPPQQLPECGHGKDAAAVDAARGEWLVDECTDCS